MLYVDIVICIGSLPIFETWPPIYRGQERTVRDRLKASQVYTQVYFWYTPFLTDFTFEFIRRPISPILSPSSRTFVELTLVSRVARSFDKMVAIDYGGGRRWRSDYKRARRCALAIATPTSEDIDLAGARSIWSWRINSSKQSKK
jgi:hypothetical protein